LGIFAVTVLGSFGLVFLSAFDFAGPPGQAKFDAVIDASKVVVVNDRTLRVRGAVKNIGDGAGTPSCWLQGYDKPFAHEAEGRLDRASPLAAGAVWNFETNLLVTSTSNYQGARFISDYYTHCN
jgi:hypothetical protein